MLFHSLEFVLLFAVVWPFAIVPYAKVRQIAMLIASYMFYMWFSVPLVSLLIFSSLLDFYVGRAIHNATDPKQRRHWLLVSLFGNLGVLFVFKYLNFFSGSFNSVSMLLTGSAPLPLYDIILPIGISFYTFQTLSYTIDIYRKRLEPTSNLLTFALYVSFFPQLVAGPIVRASKLLPQLAKGPDFVPGQLRLGLGYFMLGLIKKVVIADNLAPYVEGVFSSPHDFTGLDILFGAYAFAFQIYCDFSGYTDMARGVAYLLGYDIGINFNYPYIARSITDLWRRWHISMSSWFHDYLYTPMALRIRRHGTAGIFVALMLTFLLIGLWHGANWTFIIFGVLHGGLLSIELLAVEWRKKWTQSIPGWLDAILGVVITFNIWSVTCIIFRADSIQDALEMFRYGLTYPSSNNLGAGMWVYIAIIIAIEVLAKKTPLVKWILSNRYLFWLTMITGWCVYLIWGNIQGAEFVYFQF